MHIITVYYFSTFFSELQVFLESFFGENDNFIDIYNKI